MAKWVEKKTNGGGIYRERGENRVKVERKEGGVRAFSDGWCSLSMEG